MQLDLLQEVSPPPVRHARPVPSKPLKPTRSRPIVKLEEEKPMQVTDVIAEDLSEPDKAPGAFKTISEVAELLDVPQHVLRFWESRFSQIKPLKLRGGRRYYRPQDIETLTTIQNLLYKQGYTIKGARKMFGKKLPVLEPVAKPQPAMKTKPAISEKQHSQLSVIRQELMGLREVLKPYIA